MTIAKLKPHGNDSDLIAALERAKSQPAKQGRAKKSEFPVWTRPDLTITGWKFNEFDYGRAKIVLPSYARGLFTLDDKIVIRGYDKFFNINETATTKWPWLEENSEGPYYVTLKENGCIVFMSGLEDGTLLVTSKNSTGPRQDAPNEANHSYVASTRIERALAASGHSKLELAKELYDLNATLVGELCDDSFEEHVLPYTGDKAGIYIHGLNVNCPKFVTYPFEAVDQMTEKYGFLKTKYTVYEDINSLREFLESCAETGSWNETSVEGFVIRCKIDQGTSDFFFKYKFEQPYLMYREWREATKHSLTGSSKRQFSGVTKKYLDFVLPILRENPDMKERYLKNHGIIELRERFLTHIGKTGMQLVTKDGSTDSSSSSKYVFVTVATIGCGKTTLAVALKRLTGWGHVQNDDIEGGPKKFVGRVVQLLDLCPAVIADRNNHKAIERKQLLGDISKILTKNVKYICLNFLPDGPAGQKRLWQVTRSRIAQRGDKHQTIRNMDDHKIDMIMKGFINRFEPVDVSKQPDELFDYVIDLDIEKDTRHSLETVIDHLHNSYPDLIPNRWSSQELDEAVKYALNYEPTTVKKVQTAKPAWFCFDVQAPIVEYLDQFYAQNPDADPQFWKDLKALDRVQASFHVTLVHKNDKANVKRFNEYKQLFYRHEKNEFNKFGMVNTQITSDIRILAIAHDRRALALHVEVLNPDFDTVRIPHITIGTKTGIHAVASGPMLLSPECIKHEWNIEPKVLKDMKFSAYFA